MKRSIWIVSALLVLTLTITGCTLQSKTTTTATTTTATSPAISPSTTGSASGSINDLESMVESIYAQANPSVVNIQVIVPATLANPGGEALGSGFTWDTQGDIVTNNHLVDGATRITVTFYDGSTVEASLVGADPDSDLAVVKVNVPAQQLQPVKMADSTQLKVGQLAIAIGNPFGLQGTLTVGFVSGLGRLLPASENAVGPTYSIPDIIQTDASINPGNSGGILLNGAGQVIGVTSAIATSSGTSSGVGFAIPSAIVQKVVPALIATGHYDHPYLGVTVVSLDPDLATAMNLDASQRGALVVDVTAGAPADKAGLRAGQKQVTINGQQLIVGGDVVVAFNGQTVKSSGDLVTFLARSGSVGQTVTLTVLRNGNRIQVPVTLTARPAS